jgi:histidinol phosphatase-like PHP family hydrolase
LIALGDIRGDLHVHSNWSDGTAPVADMAAAAKAKGYDYIAITDTVSMLRWRMVWMLQGWAGRSMKSTG